MKKAGLILLLITFSCVSKTEHDKVLKKNQILSQNLKRSQKIIDSLTLEVDFMNLIRKNAQDYTIEHANKILKDYFSFYERDLAYRNVKINKINSSTFEISLEEATKSLIKESNSDVFWNHTVYKLKINSDTNYNMDRMR